MEYDDLNKVEECARNKYEAVLLAAKWARRINSKRVADAQAGDEEAAEAGAGLRITSQAYGDLLGGRIKFTRKNVEDMD